MLSSTSLWQSSAAKTPTTFRTQENSAFVTLAIPTQIWKYPTCYHHHVLSEFSNTATREPVDKSKSSSAMSENAKRSFRSCTTSWTTYVRTQGSGLSIVQTVGEPAAQLASPKSQIWTNTYRSAQCPFFDDSKFDRGITIYVVNLN